VNGIRLGLRANAAQFGLLVGLNALVGALVGLERSVLPLVGEHDFNLASRAAVLAFVVAFGVAKAVANLCAGALADRVGRRRLLVLGWLLALPVAPLLGLAPSWWLVVAANVFLGANQGLAWSMTVVMKMDLAGPARRGLALGLNESAGYLGVAVTAFISGALAASIAPRTVVWAGASVIALAGTALTVLFVRDTGGHVAREQRPHGERAAAPMRVAFAEATIRRPVLRACSQAGLVNNLNDALAWGLAPLYLAAHGADATKIGAVAAVYPGIWGVLQLGTGWLSDHTGRKPLIVIGMLVQAFALAVLVVGGGAFAPSLVAAALLGIGTALVYPTLLAAVSDVVAPRDRASIVGVYRFWRDGGFVLGALLAGFAADALGSRAAIVLVAALTGASGLWVAMTPWEPSAGVGVRLHRWVLSATSSWSMRARVLRSRAEEQHTEGGTMRAIECPCGHHLDGADDEELFRLAREHVDRDHPEIQRSDEQLRERIAADAYDLVPTPQAAQRGVISG
jgi:MFS family permease